jgi:hypothetical protein
MSKNPPKKLGTLNLNEAEKQAIAEMVQSDGFKVWKKKIIPNRSLQIAGLVYGLEPSEANMSKIQGQGYENSKQIKVLEDIADEWNKKQLDEDDNDTSV